MDFCRRNIKRHALFFFFLNQANQCYLWELSEFFSLSSFPSTCQYQVKFGIHRYVTHVLTHIGTHTYTHACKYMHTHIYMVMFTHTHMPLSSALCLYYSFQTIVIFSMVFAMKYDLSVCLDRPFF